MQTNLKDLQTNPDTFPSLPSKTDPATGDARPQAVRGGEDRIFLTSVLDDLIHCIKTGLFSINHSASLVTEKHDDPEFRSNFRNGISEHVKKIDSLLNALLNYINISTPLLKTNTMRIILEEIIEANEKPLREKGIRVFRTCEDQLPDTYMHPEQVRFVLNSLLQCAMLHAPLHGTISFSMNDPSTSNLITADLAAPHGNGGQILVTMRFPGTSLTGKSSEGTRLPQDPQHQNPVDLILSLVTEVLEKNRGAINLAIDEKKQNTVIHVKFDAERRRLVHYEPIKI